jgi:hypothetical protein
VPEPEPVYLGIFLPVASSVALTSPAASCPPLTVFTYSSIVNPAADAFTYKAVIAPFTLFIAASCLAYFSFILSSQNISCLWHND